jgi:hypothetical protein
MTGKSLEVGQTGRSFGVSSIAVLAAGAMLAGLGLSACGPDTAHASTVLRAARAATVVLAGGATRTATEGMKVPKGATVRTDPGGSATLVAAGRTVLLGSQTAVTVVDGAREQLRSGLVLIDARRSPGLSLDAGAATIGTPHGGLARVERGVLLRAASYHSTLTVRATGRKASTHVPDLYQVQVPDGGLPGARTPLALSRDSWERRYALDLLTADTDLTKLSDGLRDPSSSAAVLHAAPASLVDAPAGVSRNDTALAFLVAASSKSADVGRVLGWRAEGGSWGVVAALARANISAVSAALDALLNPTSTPTLALGGTPAGPTTSTGGAVVPTAAPSPTAGRTAQPKPTSKPKPSSSPDPVNDVVTTVESLLPSPLPSAALVPTSPSATPLISLNIGGLGISAG